MLKATLPVQVNHRRFVSDNAKLEGIIPLQRFERLIALVEDEAGEVEAQLEFKKARKHRSLVVGHLRTKVSVICQNCMAPAQIVLDTELRVLVVNSEEALAELHEDDDGLVCEGELILLVDLLEDELILALPMVGKHEEGECQSAAGDAVKAQPAVKPSSGEEGEEGEEGQESQKGASKDTYRPFAGLAGLTADMVLKKEE
ncbi:MAG: hypothetical protein ACI81O_000936 [Cyclobacteriaceae bacterium]|jgi:uncharacterized protein